MTTIPERIREEAHAALCELCTAFVCPPEDDCHCATVLREALLAAERRGREEERERCAERFSTYCYMAAQEDDPIPSRHITGARSAIRSTN